MFDCLTGCPGIVETLNPNPKALNLAPTPVVVGT